MAEQSMQHADVDSMIRTHRNVVIGKENCRFCVKAVKLLDQEQIRYKYVDWSECRGLVERIKREQKHMTFPKIFIDGAFVGGYTELRQLCKTKSQQSEDGQGAAFA